VIPTWALLVFLMSPDGHLISAHSLAGFTSITHCQNAARRLGEQPQGRGPRAVCVRQS
jgi:hypothetical protein